MSWSKPRPLKKRKGEEKVKRKRKRVDKEDDDDNFRFYFKDEIKNVEFEEEYNPRKKKHRCDCSRTVRSTDNCCKQFFNAVVDNEGHGGGIPKKELKQYFKHYRSKEVKKRPKTPPGYWDMNFFTTSEDDDTTEDEEDDEKNKKKKKKQVKSIID